MAAESGRLNLNELWLKRWNQNIEETMQGLARLQVERGWALIGAKDLLSVPSADYDLYLEALILKASLLRARTQPRESSALLAKLHRTNSELGQRTPFRLHFEIGLDHWNSEDVTQALDSFLLAEQSARTDVEKVFALSNLLWCLEALDLTRERIETKLRKLLQDCKDVEHVREQMRAYELRADFYNGRLKTQTKASLGQSLFFLTWCQALPYFGGSRRDASLTLEQINQTYLWQSSYRQRTLAGIALPTDHAVHRLGDAIDRLYLWIWLWLADDERIDLAKIEHTLTAIADQLEVDLLSKENRLLLRNALAWLNLLEPQLVKGLRSVQTHLSSHTSPRYPLLENEYAMILSFPKPLAAQFYQFQKVEDLPRLRRFREEQWKLNGQSEFDLVIDFSTGMVRQVQSQLTVHSGTLARLFHLLESESSFDTEALGELSDRQLHNLVARAKRLHPSLKVEVRGGRVTLKRGRPRLLRLHEPRLASSPRPSQLSLQKSAQKTVSLQAARLLFQTGFKREELARTFKTSKATACRLIQEWIGLGKLGKQGNGKKVIYQWKS